MHVRVYFDALNCIVVCVVVRMYSYAGHGYGYLC